MKAKVTGSIVTYNNSDIIEQCICSILEYTSELDFTLYVVDNCSSDNTVELINEKFPQVKVIRNEENRGFGHGHNQVLDIIDSEYHSIINPDITFTQTVYEPMIEYLEANKDVDMITPKICNDDGTQQHLPKYCPTVRYVIISKFKPFKYLRRRYTRQDENLNKPTEVEFCTGCFSMIRTDVFKSLKGYDTRFFMYCEDADLSRRVRQQGKIIFYPEVSVVHKWKRDNTGNLKGIMRFLSSLMKYFLKWGIKV